jgi:hypothetical protein
MTVEALTSRYRGNQLAVAFLSQLKAMTQLSGEPLQEFAVVIEQLAHLALFSFTKTSSRRREPMR